MPSVEIIFMISLSFKRSGAIPGISVIADLRAKSIFPLMIPFQNPNVTGLSGSLSGQAPAKTFRPKSTIAIVPS